MRQRKMSVTEVLVLAVLAVGIGLWATPQAAHAQGKEIKELIIAIGVDADTLNPQEQTTTLIQNMCDLIYDNFFYQDPQGKLHPRLATKSDVSADGLT
jgi:peptide/nickel transport system substrate-binding protein